MDGGNLFEEIPTNLDQEYFETLLQTKAVKIERIVSKGHASPENGWYDQDTNEWVMIVEGEAVISYDDGQ